MITFYPFYGFGADLCFFFSTVKLPQSSPLPSVGKVGYLRGFIEQIAIISN